MKKTFRQVKGKTGADEGNLSNTQGRSEDAAITPAAPDLVNRHLERSLSQNVSQKSLSLALGSLRISAVAPMEQLVGVLASPASSSGVDGRDLIKIQPPAGICPVCYNLDPNNSPKDGDRSQGKLSWARMEYNIPEGIPVGKISIEKPDVLVDRARRGCLYCCMVQMALEAVHPGWVTERTFIDIFLAPDLPVVVRLHFGDIFKLVMGGGGMLELGVDLPEGQNMEVNTIIEDPLKPSIDVEIYRPRLLPDQFTVGDVALSPLISHIGFAEEIPGHSRDQKCFDFIKDKVANCMKAHRCVRDGHLPLLPGRIIWVGTNNASHIQLLEPKNIRAKYLALSYCWGPMSSDTYITDKSTFNARKAGIRFKDLPPLFQDVVTLLACLALNISG